MASITVGSQRAPALLRRCPCLGRTRMGTKSCLVRVGDASGRVKGHGGVGGAATPQHNSQTLPGPSVGKFHIPQGWEGTYRALVGLCPLLALQTCRELLVCAVGDLLHQLQPLLHLRTEQWVGLLGDGRSEVGSGVWTIKGQD